MAGAAAGSKAGVNVQKTAAASVVRTRIPSGPCTAEPASVRPAPGVRFGRLVVIDEVEPYLWRGRVSRRQWLCGCDCGAASVVREDVLRSGHTRSCGCLRDDSVRDRRTQHGGRAGGQRPPEYEAWRALARADPPLQVCAEWRAADGLGFLAFRRDMGPRPSPRHRLVRLDEKAGFSAANCRWSDAVARRGVPRRRLRVDGREMTLREAAARHGVGYALLCKRLQRGWPVDRALRPSGA